jgi:hypothetical protein
LVLALVYLVWMVLGGQPPEARFYSPIIGQRRHAEHAVEVAGGADFVEAFVERVKEVERDDEDEDAAPVGVEARRAWLRTGGAGADG